MYKRKFIVLLALFSLGCTISYASSKVYKYRCPKCKLIQEYEIPGTKKCPNDGRVMIRIN